MTFAMRQAYKREGLGAARKIASGIGDDVIEQICSGDMEFRGDTRGGVEVWTVDRDFLVPTKVGTGEPVPRDEWVEVTGKSERHVDRVERGILMQMSDAYYLDRVHVPGEQV